jgi:hypothetical protein
VIKCALHFHFDRLIAQMLAERAKLPDEADRDRAESMSATCAAIAVPPLVSALSSQM